MSSSSGPHRGVFASVEGVTAEYGGTVLFEDLSFQVGAGWTGIVGVNGAGKSTLLDLLAGRRKVVSGKIRYLPVLSRVIHVSQRSEDRPDVAPLEASPWYHGMFELDDAVLTRWESASPGEKRRWQLASALAAEPDVLLLDEPTHHLDAKTRALFVDMLRSFSGIGFLVSHDRVLLDTLCDRTLRLHGGTGQLWPGGWSAARHSWEQEDKAVRARIELLQEQRRALKGAVEGATRRKEGADAQKSAKKRMRNAGDNDGRSILAKNLADWASLGAGRERGRLMQRLEHLDEDLSALEYPKESTESLFFQFTPTSRTWLVSLQTPELRAPGDAGGTVILRDIDLRVHREARILVSGDNGSGKTTLVKALVEQALAVGGREIAEKILWFAQEPPRGAEAAEQLAGLGGLPKEERDSAFRILATLGARIESLRHSGAPSPGEARKIELAAGLARSPWLIILDEPQNHLDLPTLEKLEAALREFPGAILTISHDPEFLAGTWTERWRVAEGRVTRE